MTDTTRPPSEMGPRETAAQQWADHITTQAETTGDGLTFGERNWLADEVWSAREADFADRDDPEPGDDR